ncbi:hypothetical protein ES703_47166 [subsurface metagenome]
MATIMELLAYLSTKEEAVTTADLAKGLHASREGTLKQLSREKGKGNVDGNSQEGWLITEKGRDELRKGEIHPTMIDEGVTPRQQFEAIGRRIGIPEERIVLATDIVWSGEYNDIKWAWEALGQADIADDLRGVWVNAWRAKLHKAIPPELETELTGAGKTAATEAGKGVTPSKRGREYIIVDDEPVRVGENLGDYSLQDAKDILAIRALKTRFAGAAQAGGAPASTPEKLSELLTALGPYLNKGSDVDALKEILADKLALQRQEILSHIPQQGTPTQPKTLIEQLTELSTLGPVLKSILGIPETPANSNPLSGIPVTVTGPDGKPAIMDFTQALDFRKFMAEEKRADESHQTKMEVAKSFKDFLVKAGTAAEHAAGAEEEE